MSEDLKSLVDELGYGRPTHLIVAEALRRRIALGGFAPNEALPTERELARTLGIGRATLRTALRQLASEGLVSTTLGRSGGTVVLAAGRASRKDRARMVEESESALEHTLEVRLALEPLAARLAAARANADEIETILRLVGEPAPTLDAYHALDSRFHTAVARASHNPLLLESVEWARTHFFTWANALWVNVDWAELRSVEAKPAETFEAEHRRIAEGIASGDCDKAQIAMTQHLALSAEQFRELLERAEASRQNSEHRT